MVTIKDRQKGLIIKEEPGVINHPTLCRILEYEHIIVLFVIPIFLGTLFLTVPHTAEYWVSYIWLFPVAFAIALVANMLGVSGAVLFVPLFSVVLPLWGTGFGPTESVIIGLFTQSFGISSATLGFFRYRLIDAKIVLLSLVVVIPAVLISSRLAFFIPNKFLFFIICLSLFIAVFSLYYSKRIVKTIGEEKSDNMTILLHIHTAAPSPAVLVDRYGKVYSYCRCGFKIRLLAHSVGAFFQGITGFGIGYLGMIGMILSGIPIKIGIGSNHVIIAVSAIIASIMYAFLSFSSEFIVIPWNVIAITVPAVIIGAQFSPYATDRVDIRILEWMFLGLLVILAVYTFYMGVIR
ncbi:MAG: sulfite exporter TauE/SafE family protein [Methanospirillaceae archaeon]|nr:sulfite exporter TauE/SafE family protein [Methanospirillaceae archaeon]